MHNVDKMTKHALKILRCEHHVWPEIMFGHFTTLYMEGLIIFTKRSTLDVWQGSEHAYGGSHKPLKIYQMDCFLYVSGGHL